MTDLETRYIEVPGDKRLVLTDGVARDGVTALGTRMTAAEGSITGLGTRMTAAEGNITSAQSAITALQAKHVYQHNLIINFGDVENFAFQLYTSSATAMTTLAEIITAMRASGSGMCFFCDADGASGQTYFRCKVNSTLNGITAYGYEEDSETYALETASISLGASDFVSCVDTVNTLI